MRGLLCIAVLVLVGASTLAQQLEILPLPDNFKGYVGEAVAVPVKIKNISDKPVTLVLRKGESQLGSTQKSYFCLGQDCREQRDELVVRLDAGQSSRERD